MFFHSTVMFYSNSENAFFFESTEFSTYPLTQNEAMKQGYTKFRSCSDQSTIPSDQTYANFYWKNDNFVFMPFYNARM